MRITETTSNFRASRAKKSKNSAQANFFGLLNSDATEDIKEAQNDAGITTLNTINSLNNIGFSADFSEKEARKLNLEYGRDVLKSLELLKKAIILGALEYNTLLNITERLNIIPVEPADLELKSLIEEIRTRAAVEIEKLKK